MYSCIKTTDSHSFGLQVLVGGPVLAKGYFDINLTMACFIKRPPGLPSDVPERLYRTGDWGSLLADGTLEIHGRCDSVVKIRGFSIETQVRVLKIIIN